jgi:hypothetical protein
MPRADLSMYSMVVARKRRDRMNHLKLVFELSDFIFMGIKDN